MRIILAIVLLCVLAGCRATDGGDGPDTPQTYGPMGYNHGWGPRPQPNPPR